MLLLKPVENPRRTWPLLPKLKTKSVWKVNFWTCLFWCNCLMLDIFDHYDSLGRISPTAHSLEIVWQLSVEDNRQGKKGWSLNATQTDQHHQNSSKPSVSVRRWPDLLMSVPVVRKRFLGFLLPDKQQVQDWHLCWLKIDLLWRWLEPFVGETPSWCRTDQGLKTKSTSCSLFQLKILASSPLWNAKISFSVAPVADNGHIITVINCCGNGGMKKIYVLYLYCCIWGLWCSFSCELITNCLYQSHQNIDFFPADGPDREPNQKAGISDCLFWTV